MSTVAIVNKTKGFPKVGLEAFQGAIPKGFYTTRDLQQSREERNGTRGHHAELANAGSAGVGRATGGSIMLFMEKQPDAAMRIVNAFDVTVGTVEVNMTNIPILQQYLQTKAGDFEYLLKSGVQLEFGRDAAKA